MTIGVRRKLFSFFIFLFVIASICVVYYTRGYRIDLQTWDISQTGSLYVEAVQNSVEIYLNDERHEDRSGILKKGTLISSVLPKKYRVLVSKEGYLPYEKNIEIFPLQVARLFHVTLVPKDLRPESAVSIPGIKAILSASNQGRVLVSTASDAYVLLDPDSTASPVSVSSYLSTLSRRTYDSIDFQPDSASTLLAQRDGVLYAINMNNDAVAPLIGSSFGEYSVRNGLFFGLGLPLTTLAPSPSPRPRTSPSPATTTPVSVYDVRTGARLDEFTAPFASSHIVEISGSRPRYAFLLKNGDVWVRDNGSFLQIAHDAKRASFSPDGAKLLFQDTDGALFVRLFRDEYEALDSPNGSSIRLQIADTSAITRLDWYADSYHLLIGYPEKIVFAEITKQEPNNQVPLVSEAYTSYAYAPAANQLYVSKEDIIEKFDLGF